MPKSMERFNAFISELRGNKKDDIVLPIGGFNPMAGPELHELLKQLIKERVEEYVTELLLEWNANQSDKAETLQVAINLIDDEGGLWSQRYLTEFENKFSNQAMLRRKIIVMNLYRSEENTKELIKRRLEETIYRNAYQLKEGMPKLLNEHVAQERHVQKQFIDKREIGVMESDTAFLKKHGTSNLYHVIFCFFYGREVCEELGGYSVDI